MPTTFDSKALILGQVWMHHKDADQLADFFKYNDLGIPLAFALAEGIVNHTPTLEQYINETWDLFLEALNIEDQGFYNLPEVWEFIETIEDYEGPLL
jgi:hypothetical protein